MLALCVRFRDQKETQKETQLNNASGYMYVRMYRSAHASAQDLVDQPDGHMGWAISGHFAVGDDTFQATSSAVVNSEEGTCLYDPARPLPARVSNVCRWICER